MNVGRSFDAVALQFTRRNGSECASGWLANSTNTEEFTEPGRGLGMTVLDLTAPTEDLPPDVPREIDPGLSKQDKVFHHTARVIGLQRPRGLSAPSGSSSDISRSLPSAITDGRSSPRAQWQPEIDQIGISAVIVGTIEVALIAIVVSFPLALLTALLSATTHQPD